jgi:hypothetical protein
LVKAITDILLLILLFLLLPVGAQGIRETLVSLQFLNLRQSVGLLGRGIRPLPNTNRIKRTDIHALSWIPTDDPSIRAAEDLSCLRPRGHCDRHHYRLADYKYFVVTTMFINFKFIVKDWNLFLCELSFVVVTSEFHIHQNVCNCKLTNYF